MSDRAIAYNNTGVRLLSIDQGSPFVALDIFKGALEVLLADTRQQVEDERQSASEVDVSGDLTPEEDEFVEENEGLPRFPRLTRVLTSESIRRVDLHMQAMNDFLSLESLNESQILPPSLMTPSLDESHIAITEAIVVPIDSRGYTPFVYTTPFEISEGIASIHGNGTIIIFNIGLVHQLINPDSPVIPAFYQRSAALLDSVPSSPETNLFHLSLVNNYGVWCAQHGNGERMSLAMEQLSRALDDYERTEDLPVFDESIRQGFRSNIEWFLTPHNGGSPVA